MTSPDRRLLNLIAAAIDPGSWEPWKQLPPVGQPHPFVDTQPYSKRLSDAMAVTKSLDSVQAGGAKIGGRAVAVIYVDFAFMAGSVGITAGEEVARTFERAADESVPLVALIASAGTRMQEGARAFLQMLKMTTAVRSFRAKSLPYISYLTNPTMGGTLASWGTQSHLTFAEPNASIGFSGPRIVELVTGTPLDPYVQSSENLHRHGLIDLIVPRDQLHDRLKTVFAALAVPSPVLLDVPNYEAEPDTQDVWTSVEESRDPRRPGALRLIRRSWTDLTSIAGDRLGGGDDPACYAAIGRLAGIPSVVLGQDRNCPTGMTPAGFRKARRAMEIASELQLPLVSIIDTSGAQLSRDSEEQGLSWELSKTLYTLTDLKSPTLSVLLGQGSGGGALALIPADVALAAQHAWLSPIAPEAASMILYKRPDEMANVARAQGIGAADLQQTGIIDVVVPERPAASHEGDVFLDRIAATITAELSRLREIPYEERMASRLNRLRALG